MKTFLDYLNEHSLLKDDITFDKKDIDALILHALEDMMLPSSSKDETTDKDVLSGDISDESMLGLTSSSVLGKYNPATGFLSKQDVIVPKNILSSDK